MTEFRLKALRVDPMSSSAHFAVFCLNGARDMAVHLANQIAYDFVVAVTDDFETNQALASAGIPLFVYLVQDWAKILEKLRSLNRGMRVLLIAHHCRVPPEVFDLVSASIVLVEPTLSAEAPVVGPAATWLVPHMAAHEDHTAYPALRRLPWPTDAATIREALAVLPPGTFVTGDFTHYLKCDANSRFLLPRPLVAYQRVHAK